MGSVRYNLSGNEPVFESMPFSIGRIVREGNGYAVRYFLTDHLGSVRTIADQAGTTIAEYDYLPYGKQHKNSSLATSDDNDFRYNGKELQERFGVDLYDSQARMQRFDGRFNSPDPLAEDFPSTSPYAYCAGNPINRIDPDGRAWFVNRENSNMMYIKDLDDLTTLTQEQIEQYAIGDISQYDRLGTDDMFGDNVAWEENDNILDESLVNFGDKSEEFMGAQGYNKVIETQTEVTTEVLKSHNEAGKIKIKSDKTIQESLSETYSYAPKENTEISSKSYSRVIKRRPTLFMNSITTRRTVTFSYSAQKNVHGLDKYGLI